MAMSREVDAKRHGISGTETGTADGSGGEALDAAEEVALEAGPFEGRSGRGPGGLSQARSAKRAKMAAVRITG